LTVKIPLGDGLSLDLYVNDNGPTIMLKNKPKILWQSIVTATQISL